MGTKTKSTSPTGKQRKHAEGDPGRVDRVGIGERDEEVAGRDVRLITFPPKMAENIRCYALTYYLPGTFVEDHRFRLHRIWIRMYRIFMQHIFRYVRVKSWLDVVLSSLSGCPEIATCVVYLSLVGTSSST